MRTPGRKTTIGATLAAAAIMIGGGAAVAADKDRPSGDLTRLAQGIARHDSFDDAVAKRLGTTADKLAAAIATAAENRIAAEEKAGSLSRADADTLRAALAEHDRLANRIAEAADVAQALGTTVAKLDAAYAETRKAQVLARIDQAVKDGLLTEKVAGEMRERVNAATFPGFGAVGHGFGGRGHGPGFGGHGSGGHGFRGGMDGSERPGAPDGFGFGPGFGSSSAPGPSSTTDPASLSSL